MLSLVLFLQLFACEFDFEFAPPPDEGASGTDGGDQPDPIPDQDNDGFLADVDCDDQNERVFPGATEHCDGVDENCDGDGDANAVDGSIWYADSDDDSYGDFNTVQVACDAPDGYVSNADDCLDTAPDGAISPDLVHPGAPEVCNGADDDCDGLSDEEPTDGLLFFPDGDGDGFPQDVAPIIGCTPPSLHMEATTNAQWDCNDYLASVHPGAAELCNALDDNCDGEIDEQAVDLRAWFVDLDADGHGDIAHSESPVTACFQGPFMSAVADDCDDSDSGRSPSVPEVCDGIDQNCDDLIDNDAVDATLYYLDGDSDGFGDLSTASVSCVDPNDSSDLSYVTDGTDCDDTVSTTGGERLWYYDGDSDGVGSGQGVSSCQPKVDHVLLNGDCDDTDAYLSPERPEICDGKDNDCDGFIDNAPPNDGSFYFLDADSDGYGDPAKGVLACDALPGFSADNTDCDDLHADNFPGATERCDGIDNNCDGAIDEQLAVSDYYSDADGDGFTGTVVQRCGLFDGLTADSQKDCDDANPAVFPRQTLEVLCNGVDDNCDGTVDEFLTVLVYADLDRDGQGDRSQIQGDRVCSVGDQQSTTHDDCDDRAPNTYLGASEVCDQKDNNCDGTIDEGLMFFDVYPDSDGDGYGVPQQPPQNVCELGPNQSTTSDDCDDSDPKTYPGAPEYCDSVDTDCDGVLDPNTCVAHTYCGTLTVSETWGPGDHVLCGTLDIGDPNNLVTLTLLAGARVLVPPGASLQVGLTGQGALIADGVTFTSETPGQPWNGLMFDWGSHPSSSITHSTIEYAGFFDPWTSSGHQGSVSLYGAPITFSNNTIKGSPSVPIMGNPESLHALGPLISFDSTNAINHVLVQGGFIQQDTTWSKLDIPYELTGPIDIEAPNMSGPPATLTLADTVTVLAQQGAGLSVGRSGPGALVANKVLFSAVSPSVPWDGLSFEGQTASNTSITHSTIDYAGFFDPATQNGRPAIQVMTPNLVFNNNIVQNSASAPLFVNIDFLGRLSKNNTYLNNQYNEIMLTSGQVNQSTTWDQPIPIHLTPDPRVNSSAPFIEVGQNTTLTLADGLTLLMDSQAVLRSGFLPGSGLIVAGSSQGVEMRAVIDPQNPGYTPHWQGIQLGNNSTTANTKLQKLTLKYAGEWPPSNTGGGNPPPETSLNGCLRSQGGGFELSDSLISNCVGNGVVLSNGASASLLRNRIEHADMTGLSVDPLSDLILFSGNTLTLNSNAPLEVHPRHLAAIDASNVLTGNVDSWDPTIKRDRIMLAGDILSNEIIVNQDLRFPNLSVPYFSIFNLSFQGSPNQPIVIQVDPGVTFVSGWSASWWFKNDASLIATGGSSTPIRWTSEEIYDGFGNTLGSWAGLRFDASTTANTQLNFISIEGAGGPVWDNFGFQDPNWNGALNVFGSGLQVDNSKFEYSGACGVYHPGFLLASSFNLSYTGTSQPNCP